MRRSRKSDKLAVLARVPLFAGLNDKQLELVGGQTTEVDLKAGSVLVDQGVIGREAMIILKGTAVATRDGEEIAQMGPGDVVGEISLIQNGPRTATVTATSDISLLVMNSAEFSSVLEVNPDVSIAILKTVAERLAHDQIG